MELLDYLHDLKRGRSLREVARGSGVSYGGVQAVFDGSTKQPTPDILERLARFFGQTEEEGRQIYHNLMSLAGYLEYLPMGAQAPSLPNSALTQAANKAVTSGQELERRQQQEDMEEEEEERE
jgi:transcriptional regulator with XRE-family HTH domain